MPFAGYEDFDACVVDQRRKGHSEESARKICGALQAESETRGYTMDRDAPPLVSRSDALHVRAVRDESRSIEVVASSDAIDSYGEIVEQKWDLSRYEQNPVVLYAHDKSELPIGRASNLRV